MSDSSEDEYTKLSADSISETSRIEVVKDLSDYVSEQTHNEDRKKSKTVALFGGFFSLGLIIGVVGPTLPDLLHQVNANYDRLSYIFLSRGFGYMIGSIISGAVLERFNAFGLLGTFLVTCSMGMMCVPATKKLSTIMFAFILTGTAMGGLDTGGNVLCLRIWGESSPPYMQSLHFTFAVGATVAPLIAKPFISVFADANELDEYTLYTTDMVFSTVKEREITELKPPNYVTHKTQFEESNTTVKTPNITDFPLMLCSNNGTCAPKTETVDVIRSRTDHLTPSEHNVTSAGGSRHTTVDMPQGTGQAITKIEDGLSPGDILIPGNIYIVYAIIAGITLLNAFVFYYFCVTSEFKCRRPSNHSPADDATDEATDKWFRIHMLIILFVFYFLYVGGEVAFGSYIYSYAINCDLKLSKDSASLLNSLFWGTFAIFRGLAIILAYFFTPLQMLLADVVLCIGASVILAVFANTSQIGIWLGTALLGAGMASLFPTGLSWLERYIRVTGNDAAILVVGASFGEMLIPFFIGQYFPDDDGTSGDDSENIDALMYLMLFIACLTFALFVIAYKLASRKGDRYSKNAEDTRCDTQMSSV
ncbi:sodium-dependent glucose transporter 1A-like isoform X2 [Anneissia japonica]|nr:sodium-dependent glucose transporter 1A-like isoform X2 [Anneissia japonica]XP_033113321.1 sodium-dependent glucose transporter 1A-like isoform X2 [Anneissia japonica]